MSLLWGDPEVKNMYAREEETITDEKNRKPLENFVGMMAKAGN